MIAMKSIQSISLQSSNSALPTTTASPLLHRRGMWLLGIFHIQGIYAATFLLAELHMRPIAVSAFVMFARWLPLVRSGGVRMVTAISLGRKKEEMRHICVSRCFSLKVNMFWVCNSSTSSLSSHFSKKKKNPF